MSTPDFSMLYNYLLVGFGLVLLMLLATKFVPQHLLRPGDERFYREASAPGPVLLFTLLWPILLVAAFVQWIRGRPTTLAIIIVFWVLGIYFCAAALILELIGRFG